MRLKEEKADMNIFKLSVVFLHVCIILGDDVSRPGMYFEKISSVNPSQAFWLITYEVSFEHFITDYHTFRQNYVETVDIMNGMVTEVPAHFPVNMSKMYVHINDGLRDEFNFLGDHLVKLSEKINNFLQIW